MAPQLSQQDALRYIRSKVDQLLKVMGTLPLRPEELDDETLISLDPIGIIAESFRQVIAHLSQTNEQLDVAQGEIRAILDTIGAAVVVIDNEDRIEDFNSRAGEWFFGSAERARILGLPAVEACACAAELADLRLAADGSMHSVVALGRDMQVSASRILDGAGLPAKTVMLFSDIAEQKKTERHLRLYAETFNHIGEGIVITDATNCIIEINRAVTRITGYSREELIGQTPNALKSGLHDKTFYEDLWCTLHERGYWQGELYDRRKDGRVIPLLESISEVRDSDGRLTHHIAVMTDISSLKETQTRLDFLAHHDPLTELPNRLLFNDRLQHAIIRAERESRYLALLFIDLDRFKNINDTLGHHVGDLLLIEAAQRLRQLVRRADTVARLGGDEFVILMETSATHPDATLLADKIIATFKQPFVINGVELHIGCSIGITLYPDDGNDAASLLKNADAAMYRAKEAGRDGHMRYSAELSEVMRAKLDLESALRLAVRDGEFELHYQPIIDITGTRLLACEALIRWPRGPVGANSPANFIPLAEETRLILPLGTWILREAIAKIRDWRAAGIELDYISVNISAIQFAQTDFADQVTQALDAAGIPGTMLQIELTENVLMHDMEQCSWALTHLRERGVRVAIDDFGTGYSSLSYLKKLPIDNLKIDRSFVRDIPEDINDCALAAAIISLARTLGLDAIAEGIETTEQQEFLVHAGCTKMQGYLYARPMPAADFLSFARHKT